jgi:hypothetical protein
LLNLIKFYYRLFSFQLGELIQQQKKHHSFDKNISINLQATFNVNEAIRSGKLSTCPLHINGRLLSDDDAINSTRLKAYFPLVALIYSERSNSSPRESINLKKNIYSKVN